MLRTSIIAAGLLVTLVVSAQATQATSGYELYSWKVKSHWYYSLLPRSSSARTYAEITTNKSVRRDTSELESELKKLPKGEEVFWMGDAPTTAKLPSAALDLKHPSRQRIKRIKAICDKLGLKLKLG